MTGPRYATPGSAPMDSVQPDPRLIDEIVTAFASGDFESVLQRSSSLVSAHPGFPFGWKALGAACTQLSSLEEAVHALSKATDLDPSDPETANALGSALIRVGRLPDARRHLQQAVTINPGYVEARINLGHVLLTAGDPSSALGQFDIAIDIGGSTPLAPVIHKFSGDALIALKQPEAALQRYDKALELDAGFPEALTGRGDALHLLGRLDEAVASYDAAIAMRADIPEIFNNRGNALRGLGRFDDALSSFDHALQLDPRRADTWYNSALALQELRRLEEAIQRYDRAIAIDSNNSIAYNNRGVALQELGLLDESLASLDQAVSLRPDDADAHLNRGVTLGELLRHSEAMEAFDTALRLKPDYPDALWNKSLVHLLNAEYAEGWRLYEARLKCKGLVALAVADESTRWRGGENLRGKTILVHSEQGLGDSIQFSRFANKIRLLGADVHLLVEKPLRRLFATSFPWATVTEKGDPLPRFDLHSPFLSLPFALRASGDDLSMRSAYLRADVLDVARWRAQTDSSVKSLKVGLVWRGNPANKNDRVRSVSLAAMLAYLPAGLRYFSLQKNPDEMERAQLSDAGVGDLSPLLTDIAETAAACETMDLVISVDTSVAHLAGALGVKTWVLIPHVPDWRWRAVGDSCIWYPTIRLFRQGDERNWRSVLGRIRFELTRLAPSA